MTSDEFKAAREKLGLTQGHLARKIGRIRTGRAIL